MSLFNQMKLSVAKALQFSMDCNIFEIPECATLMTTDKISIKVANDTQMIKATVDYIEHRIANFNIRFLIRDERRDKKTIMSANLISGHGFEVKNATGARVMDIKVPHSTVSSSIGKIVHPLGTTIYNILYDNLETNGHRFRVHHLSSDQSVISVEKMPLSVYPMLKMIGIMETECVYQFKRMDGIELARVYPKIVLNGRTLILKYEMLQLGVQMRAVILGTSLILVLHEVYPDIRNALAASIERIESGETKNI
uniref:Checkpoint protein n=1 Tax=Elaeophora elaphi TaxID=1147741 RepID=A0A0R3RVV2_9BILA